MLMSTYVEVLMLITIIAKVIPEEGMHAASAAGTWQALVWIFWNENRK